MRFGGSREARRRRRESGLALVPCAPDARIIISATAYIYVICSPPPGGKPPLLSGRTIYIALHIAFSSTPLTVSPSPSLYVARCAMAKELRILVGPSTPFFVAACHVPPLLAWPRERLRKHPELTMDPSSCRLAGCQKLEAVQSSLPLSWSPSNVYAYVADADADVDEAQSNAAKCWLYNAARRTAGETVSCMCASRFGA